MRGGRFLFLEKCGVQFRGIWNQLGIVNVWSYRVYQSEGGGQIHLPLCGE